MTREAQVRHGDKTVYVRESLMDSGASDGNYAGEAIADRFDDIEREPCCHQVRLGDGRTMVTCTEMITLDVSLYMPDGSLQFPISTVFYVMPALGDRIIIGLPEILGNFYDIFTTILADARAQRSKPRLERLAQLYDSCKEELCKERPNKGRLKDNGNEARAIKSWYSNLKHRVLNDPKVVRTLTTTSDGFSRETAKSDKLGSVVLGNAVEELCEIIEDLKNFPIASYPTEETGGYTPLQLKYGTEDARYFSLPDQLELEPGARATRLIKQYLTCN